MDKYNQVLATISPYRAIVERIKERENELDLAWYDLTGVKGVRYDKESIGSHNVAFQEELRLESLENIERLEKSINNLKEQKRELDYILDQLSPFVKETILSIYCCFPKKSTYKKISYKYHMSVSSLQYQIEKEIKKVKLP